MQIICAHILHKLLSQANCKVLNYLTYFYPSTKQKLELQCGTEFSYSLRTC